MSTVLFGNETDEDALHGRIPHYSVYIASMDAELRYAAARIEAAHKNPTWGG